MSHTFSESLSSYLQLLLQGSGGALTTILIHNNHHVSERIDLHLLHLQIILQLLHENKTQNEINCLSFLKCIKRDLAWRLYLLYVVRSFPCRPPCLQELAPSLSF